MDVLPALPSPSSAPSPWALGLDRMVHQLGVALGTMEAQSHRTTLYRPLPDDPMAWLLDTFPTFFQNPAGQPIPLAPHQHDYWDWFWRLRPGHGQHPFIAIWPRGGGKSVSTELGGACAGYFGLRRYGLYISDTQSQANGHVGNVGRMLGRLGVGRSLNRYGFSEGWNVQRLHTDDGFTLDAIGLDAAQRGIRFDEARVDFLVFDDIDRQTDSPDTIARKVEILTQTILPMGDQALAVVGVQNIPNKDGIFAMLADGRADFLFDREISGPHPAMRDLPETDWYTEGKTANGRKTYHILGGEPVWAGQDRAVCEAQLTTMGPRAWLIECQHKISLLAGELFQREWFKIVTDWPRQVRCVRYWDFASTPEPAVGGRRQAKGDPDWTVGLLMGAWGGQFWVLDMQRVRLSPKSVEDLVRLTAQTDGRGVEIWLEEEGGATGKMVTADYRTRVLPGYTVHVWHPTGSKAERAKNVASAAEAGNVFLKHGPWCATFLDEVSKFGLPGVHDDIVDTLSGAHYALTLGGGGVAGDLSLGLAMQGLRQPGMQQRAQRAAFLPGMGGGRWREAEEDAAEGWQASWA